MTGFVIAQANKSDLADVTALFRAYAAGLPVNLGPQGFERELAELPGAYGPPQGALLARGDDGTALGYAALRLLDDATCEVKRLYVRPGMRGNRLGKALVGAIIDRARELRYGEIKLDTLEHMQAAIALYRSFGFAPIPPYGTHPYEGLVCLGKTLTP